MSEGKFGEDLIQSLSEAVDHKERLHAAAPEMLEALKEAVSALEWCSKRMQSYSQGELVKKWVHEHSSIIAKAEGRE